MVDEVFMNEIIDSMEHERPTDAEMLSMAREDEEELCAGLNDALAEAGVTPCGRGSFSYAEAFTRIIRERADAQAEIDRLRALLSRADDELDAMTGLDCPETVSRDEGLMREIRAALSPSTPAAR